MNIEEFRNRRELYNPKLWEGAVKKLQALEFPDKEMSSGVASRRISAKHSGESHSTPRETHTLQTYTMNSSLDGFELIYKYNFCPACNEVRLKNATLINQIEGVVSQKYFVKNAKALTKVGVSAFGGLDLEL